MLNWTGSLAWTINTSNSSTISLFDNSGAQAKVENDSSGLVTINTGIKYAATAGANFAELNAVNGGITFGSSGTLTVSGSQVNGIKLFGSGQTINFNDTVNASNATNGGNGNKYFGFTTSGTGGQARFDEDDQPGGHTWRCRASRSPPGPARYTTASSPVSTSVNRCAS